MDLSQPLQKLRTVKLPALKLRHHATTLKVKSLELLATIKGLGIHASMEEYERRKQSIFNQLNFFQLIGGILFPVAGLISSTKLPAGLYVVACLPALVSALVLWLVYKRKHETATISYFLLYPFVTCVVYMYGLNPGISLCYILYGILSVFFIKDIGYMIFSLCFSLVSYFFLAVIIKHYVYELQHINYGLYLFNQAVALLFIFYGLFLIKKENAGYQVNILAKNEALHEKNRYIQQQAIQIRHDSTKLKKQTAELAELDNLKNKMFGIISHDLKAPLYALRNHFRFAVEKKMSLRELQQSIPDVMNDLNYTVGLMDNLLHWAKAQMQADQVNPENINIQESIHEVSMLLSLQAKAKKIRIENQSAVGLMGYIDRNMNTLVLRNLLSNAIKFTPENGVIAIGTHDHPEFIEVYVKDSGTGISNEAMHKINSNDFYSTRGTASESGTGLGLMLCKEFLARNGSRLHIESEPGYGSTFSYSIPRTA